MIKPALRMSINIDLTDLGLRTLHDRVLRSVETLGYFPTEPSESWQCLSGDAGGSIPDTPSPVLVIGDLARVVRRYTASDPHEWVTAVRRIRPYFVALVRTEQDLRCAALVGDLMRHTEMRLSVCANSDDWNAVSRCLAEALSLMQPTALLQVGYSADRDQFLFHFGDGHTAFVGWGRLGIAQLRGSLVPESATPGRGGLTLELLTADGELFEIDARAIRGIIDEGHASLIESEARHSGTELGERLRSVRARVGLTQNELSERTGLDQAVISRLERGRHQPRIDTLRRVARGLGVSVSEMLAG